MYRDGRKPPPGRNENGAEKTLFAIALVKAGLFGDGRANDALVIPGAARWASWCGLAKLGKALITVEALAADPATKQPRSKSEAFDTEQAAVDWIAVFSVLRSAASIRLSHDEARRLRNGAHDTGAAWPGSQDPRSVPLGLAQAGRADTRSPPGTHDHQRCG